MFNGSGVYILDDQLDFQVPAYPEKITTLVPEEIDDTNETIWVDAESGSTFALNAVASAVLELCDGHHTAQDIAAIVSETLAEEIDVVATDTQGILLEFSAHGLIQTTA